MQRKRKLLKRFSCCAVAALVCFSHLSFIKVCEPKQTVTVQADSPTFTENLDLAREINGASSTAIGKLSKYADTFSKDSAFAKKLKQTGGYAALIGDALNAVNGGIKAYDKNSNFFENVFNIAGGAVSGFFGLNEESDVSSSEDALLQELLQELSYDMESVEATVVEINEQLTELEEKLDEDFASLSMDIKNLSDDIKDARDEAFLNEFNQTNNADAFGYTPFFKPNLEKRYNELTVALKGKDPDTIKQAYDNLYLVVKQTNQLYNYLTGDTSITGKRVLDVLYEYSLRTNAEHAEAITLTFAQDVYATYTFATYLKTLCYHYQILYGLEHGQEYSAYYYVNQGATAEESVQYSSIETEAQSLAVKQQKINEVMAAFFVKVLRPHGEFGYSTAEGWTTVPYCETLEEEGYRTTGYNRESNGQPVYYRENNMLSKGDVISLSTLPGEYIEPFDKQSFTFTVDDETQAQVSNDGTVTVLGESGGSFTVTYAYAGVTCYTTTFHIVNQPYAGGMGIESAPYLISNEGQFKNMSFDTSKAHFRLINDIRYGSFTTSSVRRFNGVLDGNGYTVTDATLQPTYFRNSSGSEFSFYTGLFHIIEKGATVKNLNVACLSGSTLSATINEPLTNFQISSNYNPYLRYYAGIFAAQNQGVIDNCHATQISITPSLSFTTTLLAPSVSIYSGGITGYNGGTVSNCNLTQSNISVSSSLNNTLNSGAQSAMEATIYLGGIVGYNANTAVNTFSMGNDLSARSEVLSSTWIGKDLSSVYASYLFGYDASASTSDPEAEPANNYYNRNNCTLSAVSTSSRGEQYSSKYTKYYGYNMVTPQLETPEQIASFSNYLTNNQLKLDEEGSVVFDNAIYDSIAILSLPHKRTYLQGEQLNLSGLLLSRTRYDGTEESFGGHTVSGYDSEKLGEQTVTVSWKDLSASFTIRVQCPHKWIIDGYEKSTCEEGGFVQYACESCHETQTKELLVGDHVYGEWIITKYPTANEDGEELCACAVCGNNATRSIPKLDSTDYAKIFTTAVEAISITNGADKLNAVKYAFATYKNVQNKDDVATAYAKLQSYIKEYNQDAKELNGEFLSANEVAVSVIASVFSASIALSAVLFLLKNRL